MLQEVARAAEADSVEASSASTPPAAETTRAADAARLNAVVTADEAVTAGAASAMVAAGDSEAEAGFKYVGVPSMQQAGVAEQRSTAQVNSS